MSARRPSLNSVAAIAVALIVCLAASRPAVAVSLPWTLGVQMIDSLTAEPAGQHEPAGHLVISELMTGGASALDEFIEIHNPTVQALPLEGLEVIYVTATGATISRRAAWSAGAPSVPPGGHVLIANESGIFAPIADAVYGSGLAAAGGSVALRILGAASAIDAVGWGNAASSWLEGGPAAAPSPGSSLERLPGGASGSWQDTDDNVIDFVVRAIPEPQNSGSPPRPGNPHPSPSASPSPVPSSVPGTPAPTATPSPSAAPAPLTIAEARSRPNGSTVTVAGYALTDSTFAEGGGYLADAGAGIAVLLSSATFERGSRLEVTGQIDDRYHQRTIRATASGIVLIGPGQEPEAVETTTGSVGEVHEGRLVRLRGLVLGAPTVLAAGLAYDLSDGSGPVRVLVGALTGIDTDSWTKGVELELVGVVGQRDSTGGGTAGYRVQPRDDADILALVVPTPSASPGPSPSPGPTNGPLPTDDPGMPLVTIATARSSATGTSARVRGVVTAPSGLLAPGSAILQDPTGAILLRHSDEVGPLVRGELIEVTGTRSTLSGMLSLRVTRPASRLGNQAEPPAVRLASGGLGESHEARLVIVRGAVTTGPRRSSANNVFFSIDDGSGPAAIAVLARTGIDVGGLQRGAWVEVQGVLGQETTGSQPDRGYRIWPRDGTDLRIIAAPTSAGSAGDSGTGSLSGVAWHPSDEHGSDSGADGVAHDLGPLLSGEEALVNATLVVAAWPELGLAALLWDGERLAAIAQSDDDAEQVRSALGPRHPPISVGIRGRAAPGSVGDLHLDLVELSGPESVMLESGRPEPPASRMPEDETPTWVRLVGSVEAGAVRAADRSIHVELACGEAPPLTDLARAPLIIEGIGLGGPPRRLIVPCGGLNGMPLLAVAAAPPAPGPRSPFTPPPDASLEPLAEEPSIAGALALLAAALAALGSFGAVALRTGAVQRAVAEARRLLGQRDPAAAGSPAAEPSAAPAGVSTAPTLMVIANPEELGSPASRTRGSLP